MLCKINFFELIFVQILCNQVNSKQIYFTWIDNILDRKQLQNVCQDPMLFLNQRLFVVSLQDVQYLIKFTHISIEQTAHFRMLIYCCIVVIIVVMSRYQNLNYRQDTAVLHAIKVQFWFKLFQDGSSLSQQTMKKIRFSKTCSNLITKRLSN